MNTSFATRNSTSLRALLLLVLLGGCAGKSPGPLGGKTGQETAQPGATTPQGSARPLTSSAGDQASPAFFPDGTSLVFQNNSDGNWELYTLELPSGEPRRVTDTPENEEDPSISPDGRWILATVHAPVLDKDPARDIALVSRDGKTRTLLVSDAADDWYPRFSPDGSQVYFVSDRVETRAGAEDSDRRSAIFRVSRDGGPVEQLTEGADETAPLPLADGSLLFRDKDGHIRKRLPDGSLELLYSGSWILGMPCRGSLDDLWLAGSENLDSPSRILHTTPAFAAIDPIDLASRQEDRGPALSPDGKFLAFYGRVGGQWDLFLLDVKP